MSEIVAPRSFTPLVGLATVVVDTETTGLDPKHDRVVQVAARHMHGTEPGESSIDMLVDPGMPVPPSSTAIHGISDGDVAGAPSFPAIAGEVLAFIGQRIVVGHNIGFDLAILAGEAERHDVDWPLLRALDVASVARLLNPSLPDHGFETIAAWLGVGIVERHTAAGDVQTTAAMWAALIPRLAERGVRTVGEVERLLGAQRGATADGHAAAGWQERVAPERSEARMAALAPLDPYPFRHRLRDVMSAPPVFASPDLSLLDAARRMADAGISSLLVGSDPDAPADGIVTERDVLRALASDGRDVGDVSLADAMSAPVEGLAADEPLYRALGRMSRLGLRHLAVWENDGRIVGIVSARDLLRQRLTETYILGDHIETARDPAALAEAWGRLPAAAERLLVERIDAGEIARVVSAELRAITARAATLAVARMVADGHGDPPCPWSLLVLGSGGRGESLLAADQDNALIYDGDAQHDDWFARFGAHIADFLDAAGIVYCKGGVMAKSPDWRHTPAGWRAQIGAWLSHARPDDLLNVDIFFDMRAVAGDSALAAGLQRDALDAASRSLPFLGLLAAQIAELRAPLGYFGGWQKHDGRVDLKLGGLMPITAVARLLALRFAISERATPERLRRTADDGRLPHGDARLLIRLHGELMDLILRQQIADLRAGLKPSTRVDVRLLLDRESDRALRRRLGELENVLAAARGVAAGQAV